MDYDAVLLQVLDLRQREKRLSYRVLKRRFGLTDDDLEDLKEDLIYAKQLAVDEDGRVLVWSGTSEAMPPPASPPAHALDRTPLTYTPQHLTEKILASRAAFEGERKEVTSLFADLKDSTELIRDLDPEAAQQLLDPALRRMMDAVHRYEGTVNQVLGDGIMALFGAPIAHEDHAIRACYAALAMQAAMREYTEKIRRAHGLEMRIRVGLNAGEVVVRAIGNDLQMDYSAVGQTTHLAARMEQLATPGSIRLTAETLRLVEGLVRVDALGSVPVKGLAEPVAVFELVGASAIHRRLQAAAARGLTRFVGREREIEALGQALERAAAGHGQVVAVVGEAGVGKSRLLYEFVHSHRTQGWLVLEAPSVSYGKATPYFPVIDLLKRYAHVEEHDDARTIRAKVTGQVLTLDDTLQETIPALLSLLDALPEDSSFQKLDPPQRRQRTLDGLKRVLLRESQTQPLVLVFEDLHWIDSETQALLDSLIESMPTARLLLLVNYRPEYQHGWGSKTYYTQLRLDPLPPVSAEEFLPALLGDDPSLAPLTRLFPEHEYTFKHALTHEVANGSLLQERRRELHAHIVGALEALAGDRVAEQVERLAHHALRGEVWDKALAYFRQAGEKAMARSAHREAVEYFEQALSTLPHLPAQYDTHEQAIDLRLALRSALLMLGDFGRILEALREAEALAGSLDDPLRLAQISLFLSAHFRTVSAHDQAIATAQRAHGLATTNGDVLLQALSSHYLGVSYQAQGDYRRAIDCLGQTVAALDGARLHERFGQVIPPAVLSSAWLAACHAELGRFAEGRALGEAGLRKAEMGDHLASLMVASWGIGLLALRQGNLSRALPLFERAVGICQDADIPTYFPWIASALGAAYTLAERVADAVSLLTQAMEQSAATENVSFQALCRLPLSEAQLLTGHVEEAHALAEGALTHAREHQERGHQAYALRLLGEIAVRRDPPRVEEAETHYREALMLADELGMRPLLAHCHHDLGILYAKFGQREQARAELSAAIELYRTMEMTFWLPQAEAKLVQIGAAGETGRV